MSGAVIVDVGRVAIGFSDIAKRVVDDSTEELLLGELASAFSRTATTTSSLEERAFCVEAAVKLRALSEWMKDNSR